MSISSAKNLILLILLPLLALVAMWYVPRLVGTDAEPQTSVEETNFAESSGEWWLVSGGRASLEQGRISTITGNLSASDKWRKSYLRRNPLDTDNGFHPQNIFLLLTRAEHSVPESQVYFNVLKTNLSPSPNRNKWNGVYLVSRYKDESSFYQVGLTVDRRAVIRKKVEGAYSLLAEEQVFAGAEYEKEVEPNLMPHDTWMGLRSTLSENEGEVHITLEADLEGTGEWQVLAEAVDNGVIVESAGHSGLKSDFMDVQFTGFSVRED